MLSTTVAAILLPERWFYDEELSNELPIWELLSEANERSVGSVRLLYRLAVDNDHAFEEVFQPYDVSFDR